MNEFLEGLIGIAFFVAIGWFFVTLRWQINKSVFDKIEFPPYESKPLWEIRYHRPSKSKPKK